MTASHNQSSRRATRRATLKRPAGPGECSGKVSGNNSLELGYGMDYYARLQSRDRACGSVGQKRQRRDQ